MGFALIGTGSFFVTSGNAEYVMFSEEGEFHHHLASSCSGGVE